MGYTIPLGTITVPVDGSAAIPLNLPQTQMLRSITLRFSGAATLGSSPDVHQDGFARSIHARVYYDSDPAVDLDGDCLLHYNELHNGVAEDYTEFPETAGAQVATWNTVIQQADPRLETSPDSTMVDMRLATNPRIELQFLGIGRITPTAASSMTSLTCAVECEVELIPANWPLEPVLAQRRWRQVVTTNLAASNNSQAREQNFGRFVRNYTLISRTASATPNVRSNLLTEVEIVPNQVKQGSSNWTALQTRTRMRSQFAPGTGVAMFDFDPARSLAPATMLDLRGARQMQLAYSVGAAADGIVVTAVEESVLLPDPEALQRLAGILRGSV